MVIHFGCCRGYCRGCRICGSRSLGGNLKRDISETPTMKINSRFLHTTVSMTDSRSAEDRPKRHKHALETKLIVLWFCGDTVQFGKMAEATGVASELGRGEELSVSCKRLIGMVGAPRVSLSGLAEGYGCLTEASSIWPMASETTSVASTAHKTWRRNPYRQLQFGALLSL